MTFHDEDRCAARLAVSCIMRWAKIVIHVIK